MSPDFLLDDDSKQNLADLLKEFDQHKVLPYVGAGFSMSPGDDRGCPSWNGFIQDLYDNYCNEMTAEEIKEFKQSSRIYGNEQKLSILKNVMTERLFFDAISNTFVKPTDSNYPTGFEKKFKLFHQVFHGPWFTTNLDQFIEKTYPRGIENLVVVKQLTGNASFNNYESKKSEKKPLYKLHGDVDSDECIVFTHKDYVDAYGHKSEFDLNKTLPKFFDRLFTNYSLLFIGCSLTLDRPLKVLKALVCNSEHRDQFALLLKSEWNGVNQRLIRELGIKPIYLQDFADINNVFEYILSHTVRADVNVSNATFENPPNVFVGRTEFLNELEARIFAVANGDTTNVQACVIQGYGGIGKTTLARKVLTKCGINFDYCFEVQVDDRTPIEIANQFANNLGHAYKKYTDDAQASAYIYSQFQNNKMLVLFDDVKAKEVLRNFLSPKLSLSKCFLIITTRDIEIQNLFKNSYPSINSYPIKLEEFKTTEALELFKELLREDYCDAQKENYEKIARIVNFLPLTLSLMISNMMFGNRYSAREILEKLEEQRLFELAEKAGEMPLNEKERSIKQVYDLTAPSLSDNDKICLALMAVCKNVNIPESFLIAMQSHLISTIKPHGFHLNKDEFISHLRWLERFSWCKRHEEKDQMFYEIHQLIRDVITKELINKQFNQIDYEELFADTLHHHYIVKQKESTLLDNWIDQTFKAVHWLYDREDERLKFWASSTFFNYCKRRGYGEKFRQYAKWTTEVFEHEANVLSMSLGNEAIMLREHGENEIALKRHYEEQKIDLDVNNKKGLAISYTNQAIVEYQKGKGKGYIKALKLHEAAKQIKVELDDKIGLCINYLNEASIFYRQDKYDQAINHLQHVIKVCNQIDGDSKNQELLSCAYDNEAAVLYSQRKFVEALESNKKAQSIKQNLGDKVGEVHCLTNQSEIHQSLKDLEAALRSVKSAIKISKERNLPIDTLVQRKDQLEKSLYN